MSMFNNIYQRMLKWNLSRLTKQFVIVGIVLALGSSYFAYTRLYVNDEKHFWMAIEDSMSLPSVTRILRSGGTGNQVVQTQQFLFSPEMASASRVTFDQRSATELTSVVTEGLSFVDAQYSRYTFFETNQPRPDGSLPDLNSLLGAWEENVATGDEIEQARLNYISELVTLVIFGNFDSEYKRDVIGQLRDQEVYEISPTGTLDDEIGDEPVRSYSVNIKLKPYVELLNQSFVRAGYGDFPPLDSENYQEDAQVPATIAVSKRTGQVRSISFGNRVEEYDGHGILKTIDRPNAQYSAGELERLVTEQIQGAPL